MFGVSQASKPTGFFGRLSARGMALGHRGFYENTAKVLDLQPGDSFLEIGFGSGLFIKKYASHVSRIAGLDYSEDMVKLATDINKDLVKSGKAEFKQGNASELPWNDNTFSAVAGIETFFFWPKPETALKEILRVLEPEGRLVIEMAYNKDDGKDHTKTAKKHKLTLYSSEEIKTLLNKTGFTDISTTYYQSLWIPFKGHIVSKGMVIKATKPKTVHT